MNQSVGIVVLNWNGEKVIKDCLISLSKIQYDNHRIIVIDNNSTDDSVNSIEQNLSNVDLIQLDRNYGFADGYNKGIESIKNKPDYLIFLNNDTEVDSNFVKPLIKQLSEDSKIGQTVPKILYHNDKNKIWYAGGKVNLWTGQIKHIGIREIDSSAYGKLDMTDYATGCCFAMRYNDFIDIGGFDSSFPMYCEDVDLSLRIWEFGQTVQYIPESKIWHKISASVGGEFSFNKIVRKLRGHIKLFGKHSTVFQLITISLLWLISIPFLILKLFYLKVFRNAK